MLQSRDQGHIEEKRRKVTISEAQSVTKVTGSEDESTVKVKKQVTGTEVTKSTVKDKGK